MENYTDQSSDCTELLDWLLDQHHVILQHEETGHSGTHSSWPVQDPNMVLPPEQANDHFLKALLNATDTASGSPLWSPSPSDSGISEDHASDHMDSPQRSESPPEGVQYDSQRADTQAALEGNFPAGLHGWNPTLPSGRTDMSHYPSNLHKAYMPSGFPLTVKDLLLSGTAESTPLPSQNSIQELILNEDEKKLLAKEGVTLPNQLPLTKNEERILKKIRRKIRNKQSAQESRKKKKEYIDGLEGRMAACSAHNQELQRKVSQLEKCNISLMEQLRRLQALVMNTSNKPAQTRTRIMVLMLSFSLILFPNLKSFSGSTVNQGDFAPVRIQSRSLQNLQASRVLHVSDPPFSTEDESQHLEQQFPADPGLRDITALMRQLKVNEEPETVTGNCTHEERISHYHVDPITGHIATVTLDPTHSARLRPHADDM
ncbi:cyclic AMP-responsive element-binding protein 3-like protein 3-A [Neosynchiropus ocellatus]